MLEFEWSTNYEGRCGNCHSFLGESDKYCRYCGSRRGEGAFEPYKNFLECECVYGPPATYKLVQCATCQKVWEVSSAKYYCPDCGIETKFIEFTDGSALDPPFFAG